MEYKAVSIPKLSPRLLSVNPRATDLGQLILLRSLRDSWSISPQSTRTHAQSEWPLVLMGTECFLWSQETALTSQLY